MDKKDSQNSQTRRSPAAVGVFCIFVVLLVGAIILNFGIRATLTSLYPGRDFTGFGALFGLPIGAIGAFILCGIFPVERMFEVNSKIKRLSRRLIIVVIIVSVGMAIWDNAVWQKGVNLKIQETKRKEALEDAKILQAFENNTTVPVKFSLTWSNFDGAAPDTRNMNISQRGAPNIKFAIEYIIEPIGKIDMPSYTINNSLSYVGEVTRSGYEKLKRNKYTRWLRLWSK